MLYTVNLEIFDVNAVWGCSYENFSTRKFVIQKFNNTKISRSIVDLL